MGFVDNAGFVISICNLTVSGLEIGVQEKPIGDVEVEGAEVGAQYDAANPTKLTPSMKNGWAMDAWQWQRSSDGKKWDNIPNATNKTYTIISADDGNQIRVVVTMAYGKAASDPIAVGVVLNLNGGGVDEELIASVSNAEAEALEFEWKRLPKGSDSNVGDNWKPFEGAASSDGVSTYTPGLDDVGATYRVSATYKETEQTLEREYMVPEIAIDVTIYSGSVETSPVGPTAWIGDTLSVKAGTGGLGDNFTYALFLTDAPTTNLATERSYLVAPTSVGKDIGAKIDYTSGNGSIISATSPTVINIVAPSVTVRPAAPRVNTELTATVNNVNAKGEGATNGYCVRYRWYNTANSSVVLAKTKTYTPGQAGNYQVRITLHDNANGGVRVGAEYTSAIVSVSA